MIRLDRKLCRDILKITDKYDVPIVFDSRAGGFAVWPGHHPDAVSSPSVPIGDIPGSLDRLAARGFIKVLTGAWGGGTVFYVTPYLRHANAFWFDRFTKTYIGGFVSGVLTSVVAGTILHFIGLL